MVCQMAGEGVAKVMSSPTLLSSHVDLVAWPGVSSGTTASTQYLPASLWTARPDKKYYVGRFKVPCCTVHTCPLMIGSMASRDGIPAGPPTYTLTLGLMSLHCTVC